MWILLCRFDFFDISFHILFSGCDIFLCNVMIYYMMFGMVNLIVRYLGNPLSLGDKKEESFGDCC